MGDSDRNHRSACWATLRGELERQPAEHQNGHFSLVEYGSGGGALSLAIAGRFPNATVLSLEGDAGLQEEHLAAVAHRNLWNNVLCAASTGSAVANKFYESPEFFRYQVVSANLLDTVLKATTTSSKGGSGGASYLGSLLSTGLTSFLHLPTVAHLSLTMHTFFPAGPAVAPKSKGLRETSRRRIGLG